jgi:uncharacterized protein YerC
MSKPKGESNVEVPAELIKELLTDSEWRMVKQRLQIIKLIEQGLSIRAIAAEAKVGTDTVVRIARKFEGSQPLKDAIRKYSSPKPQSSKWVFGKSENEESA